MKRRTINTLIASIVLTFGMASCDVLDLNNTEKLSDQAIWSTEGAAENYVTASYKIFTDISQVSESRKQYYDSYSDLMKSTSWDQYNHAYNKALLQVSAFNTGSAGAFECWSDVYTRIRRANVLLDEITRYGEPKFGKEWCDVRRAEVRFCRAFAYFRLIRIYGGIVLRTENSGSHGVDDGSYEEDIHKARLSEADSWKFVIQELKDAAAALPKEWPGWEGRATKQSAYGLLSRVALYAQDWQTVVDAADELLKLNVGVALDPDYASLFKVEGEGGTLKSNEILFALYYQKGSVIHYYDRNNRPIGDQSRYGAAVYAEHVPTAELADMYEFKDGEEFSWDGYAQNHADPYTDREPRFHATIMYNGCTWEDRTIETFVGGTDGFVEFTQSSSTSGHTCTGYYLRKYLQEGNTTFENDKSWQYDAVIRYGEVLLNKAEAYAELDFGANKEKALGALNEVRARVGLPAKTASSKEQFMELLRKERCVELAGEGFRYWDLRRWKLAGKVLNGQNAHGVKITNNEGTYTYEKVECDGGTKRIFLDKYYYFSLPTDELANNKLCENNPYW